MGASVWAWKTRTRNESELWLGRTLVWLAISGRGARLHCRPTAGSRDRRIASEHPCWDPKDGELCLSRTKPEETLVEVRSGSDVQIDRQT